MKCNNFKKSNAGFTLVELIVVIAIMAILSGVGVVGYGAYVEHSRKGLDEKTVKEICYAIDVASKSYTYSLEEVLQVGEQVDVEGIKSSGAQIPVGLIVLTPDGTQVITAGNGKGTTAKAGCKMSTLSEYYRDMTVYNKLKQATEEEIIGALGKSLDKIEYCTTCSSAIPSGSKNRVKLSDISKWIKGNKCVQHIDGKGKVEADIYGDVAGTARIENAGSSNTDPTVLSKMLMASFGDSFYSDLKLQSTDWKYGTLPAFYSDGVEIWAGVDTLAGTFYDLTHLKTPLGESILNKPIREKMSVGEYNSKGDMIYKIASKTVKKHTEKDFVLLWESYAKKTNVGGLNSDYGFNGQQDGRETYSAIRASFNNCFASYAKANGHTDHYSTLTTFGEPAAEVINAKVGNLLGDVASKALKDIYNVDISDDNLPKQLCLAAFNKENKTAVYEALSCQANDPIAKVCECNECETLFKQYINSGSCKADARAVYQTFVTAAKSNDNIVGDNAKIDFMEYYGSFLAQFQNIYSTAQALAKDKSAIIVSVYYQDGLYSYDVSPNSILESSVTPIED